MKTRRRYDQINPHPTHRGKHKEILQSLMTTEHITSAGQVPEVKLGPAKVVSKPLLLFS